MAYLAKGNNPDLLSVCEEMGVEVDQSSKERTRKKKKKGKKEVNKKKKKGKKEKGKGEERMAREARQHELELRKLELSQQNQPLNDESGRRVEIGPKIQLTQITTKFDEKHDEISLYLILKGRQN
ncbi:hypothetical protein TNCV_172461 [Trichonephila clavipes]|nr:hypothetical protein TNCV_172461 [Trichonephila clavipes]